MVPNSNWHLVLCIISYQYMHTTPACTPALLTSHVTSPCSCAPTMQGSNSLKKKMKERLRTTGKMDPHMYDQFNTGRLFACIASR